MSNVAILTKIPSKNFVDSMQSLAILNGITLTENDSVLICGAIQGCFKYPRQHNLNFDAWLFTFLDLFSQCDNKTEKLATAEIMQEMYWGSPLTELQNTGKS